VIQIIVALIGVITAVLSTTSTSSVKAASDAADASFIKRIETNEKSIQNLQKLIKRVELRVLKHMLMDKSLTISQRLDAGAEFISLGGNGEGATTYKWLQNKYSKHLDKTEAEVREIEGDK